MPRRGREESKEEERVAHDEVGSRRDRRTNLRPSHHTQATTGTQASFTHSLGRADNMGRKNRRGKGVAPPPRSNQLPSQLGSSPPLALSSTPANVRQRGKKKIKGAAAEVWEERERVLGVGDGSARVCVDDPSSGGKVRRPVASFAGFLRRSTPRPTLARNARTPSRGHERARPK